MTQVALPKAPRPTPNDITAEGLKYNSYLYYVSNPKKRSIELLHELWRKSQERDERNWAEREALIQQIIGPNSNKKKTYLVYTRPEARRLKHQTPEGYKENWWVYKIHWLESFQGWGYSFDHVKKPRGRIDTATGDKFYELDSNRSSFTWVIWDKLWPAIKRWIHENHPPVRPHGSEFFTLEIAGFTYWVRIDIVPNRDLSVFRPQISHYEWLGEKTFAHHVIE